MTTTDTRFQHCEVACSGALLASTHLILHSPDVVPLWLSVNWWDTKVRRPRGGQLGTTLPTRATRRPRAEGRKEGQQACRSSPRKPERDGRAMGRVETREARTAAGHCLKRHGLC